MARENIEPRDQKRLDTLNRRYSKDTRTGWVKAAGRASPTKFNSERAKAANDIRWAKQRAEKLKEHMKKQSEE